MKIIIRGNYRVGKTTMVQELLKEIGPGAGFYTENVSGRWQNVVIELFLRGLMALEVEGKRLGPTSSLWLAPFLEEPCSGSSHQHYFVSLVITSLALATTKALSAPMYCGG